MLWIAFYKSISFKAKMICRISDTARSRADFRVPARDAFGVSEGTEGVVCQR
eukprot:IDg10847t1